MGESKAQTKARDEMDRCVQKAAPIIDEVFDGDCYWVLGVFRRVDGDEEHMLAASVSNVLVDEGVKAILRQTLEAIESGSAGESEIVRFLKEGWVH